MLWALSLAFWGFVALSSLVLFPLAVLVFSVTAPFDRRRALLHRFTCFWASLYTFLNPAWPVKIYGRERLHESSPTVIVANHLSLLDILVMFRLQSHFKWVSKQENFNIPVIGWNMKLCGYIPLRRGTMASIASMMRLCNEALTGGSSIVMFPEGTRSSTGRLRSFKPGAFDIAKLNGVPIQPIVLRGTGDALPKSGFVLQGRHPISIEILDPIPPSEVEKYEAEEMMARVRDSIAEHLAGPPKG
ncbi:MAG: 1-acylglycerol-3-phosphate O-acyltransferase [Myxococcota bacterium]|jgi:1-acyl-sn-glycerol-3-phosphate acyltransferase